jgi:hypothetical protein
VDRRNPWRRAAGATVGVVGVSLLAAAAVEAVNTLPDLFGDVHMSGDALAWMTLAVVPMALAGLLTVLLAWLLWRGELDGVALALVWVVVFELCAWTLLTGRGWLTWIVAVGPPMVAGLLLAEWVAGRARGGASRLNGT